MNLCNPFNRLEKKEMPQTFGEKIRASPEGKWAHARPIGRQDRSSSKSYIWELEDENPPRPSAEKNSKDCRGTWRDQRLPVLDEKDQKKETAQDLAFYRKYRTVDPATKDKVRQMLDLMIKKSTTAPSPVIKKWATELTQLLRAVLGDERFPVDVEKLAMEVSASRFPKDPLKAIKGGNLPGFEGALYPLGDPRDGWAIIYNNANVSPGRIRFTTGHEFGHYLAHRHLLPDGIECDDKVVIQRAGIGIEKEADEFAAYLLMPFDDFRKRVSSPINRA